MGIFNIKNIKCHQANQLHQLLRSIDNNQPLSENSHPTLIHKLLNKPTKFLQFHGKESQLNNYTQDQVTPIFCHLNQLTQALKPHNIMEIKTFQATSGLNLGPSKNLTMLELLSQLLLEVEAKLLVPQ